MKILSSSIVKYVQIQTTSHTFKVDQDGEVWVWSGMRKAWIETYHDFEEDDLNIIAEAGMAQFKLDKGY